MKISCFAMRSFGKLRKDFTGAGERISNYLCVLLVCLPGSEDYQSLSRLWQAKITEIEHLPTHAKTQLGEHLNHGREPRQGVDLPRETESLFKRNDAWLDFVN